MNKTNSPKERKINLGSAIIGGTVALFIGVFIGVNFNSLSSFLPYLGFNKNTEMDWDSLNEVYSALSSNYDGELDQKTLIEGAKKGLTESIGDDYTVYMDPEENLDADWFRNIVRQISSWRCWCWHWCRNGYARWLCPRNSHTAR